MVYYTIVINVRQRKEVCIMWTVVYIAKNAELAGRLRAALSERDIIVMVRALSHGQDSADAGYEILVPGAEVEEALEIIIDEA